MPAGPLRWSCRRDWRCRGCYRCSLLPSRDSGTAAFLPRLWDWMCGLLPNRELDEAIEWGVEILRVVSKGTKGGPEFYCESPTMGTFPSIMADCLGTLASFRSFQLIDHAKTAIRRKQFRICRFIKAVLLLNTRFTENPRYKDTKKRFDVIIMKFSLTNSLITA